jgi:predicted small metal-binding protein
MAKSLGCADMGYECAFRVSAADDEADLIVNTAVSHASSHHPELVADEPALREALRANIKELLDQSGYNRSSNIVS